jgi:hypothetical protein
VVVASASAATPTKPVHATMATTSTTPLADTPWRYTIVVKDRAGKPLAAKARLQILLGALVVGCWKGTAIEQVLGRQLGYWIAFKGKRIGVLTWPCAVGGRQADLPGDGGGSRACPQAARAGDGQASLVTSGLPRREVVCSSRRSRSFAAMRSPADARSGRRRRPHLHELAGRVLDVLRVAAVVACEEEVRVEIGDPPFRFAASVCRIELITSKRSVWS